MYLTDFRENTLQDVITKIEPDLFETVTGLTVKDFHLLVRLKVFNTEHISPLFERVIIASGTSNRQTKALAASVRDQVREAGFAKPRIEGEENGEWIIVDCGAAVVHVMQPAIRQYYHLEEIWGDKPVRLKHGADKVVAAKAPEAAPAKKRASTGQASAKTGAKTGSKSASKSAAKATGALIVDGLSE